MTTQTNKNQTETAETISIALWCHISLYPTQVSRRDILLCFLSYLFTIFTCFSRGMYGGGVMEGTCVILVLCVHFYVSWCISFFDAVLLNARVFVLCARRGASAVSSRFVVFPRPFFSFSLCSLIHSNVSTSNSFCIAPFAAFFAPFVNTSLSVSWGGLPLASRCATRSRGQSREICSCERSEFSSFKKRRLKRRHCAEGEVAKLKTGK